MRWARRILIAIALVVVLIGTAIILLLTIDLGRFKSNLENYVSEATGRQFAIAGRFEPSIGGTVDLVAEGVRLENAEWGTAENILELERLVVSVDTWSLLSGPIEVLNLEVEGLTLHVEKELETQQWSWSFGDASAVADDDEYREPFELPLWLRQARLQRIHVIYGQGWLDAPRSISLSHGNLAADERDLLGMDLSGALGDLPIRADGFVGPLQALLDGRGPRWELEVTVGKFIATTEGSFRDLFSVEGPQIHAVMQGPSAERFLALFGLPPLARGPVDITGILTESSEGIDLRVEGAFGDLTTDIVGRTESLATIGKGDLAVDVRGPNLQAIGELFNAGFLPATAFAIDGALATSADTLDLQSIVLSAGEARLEIDGKLAPTEADPAARLRLSVTGMEVRDFLPETLAERLPSGAFDVRAIAAGGLQQPQVRELTAKLGVHELTIDGVLPAAAEMTGLDIAVAARGPDFNQIVGPWAERDIAAEPYLLNTRISNSGDGFVVKDLTFELSTASVAMTGTSGTLPNLEGMNTSVSIKGEDLQAMMEPWLDVAFPAVPFELDGRIVESDGALQLSNITYNIDDARGTLDGTTGVLPSLDGLRMNTFLAGPDVSRYAEMLGGLEESALLPATAFETRGSFSKTSAGWFVNPWAIRVGDSQLEMNGALGNFDGAAGIDINIKASGPDLRRFLPNRDIEVPVPYEVDGGLRIGDTDIELKEVDIRIGKATAWFDGRLPIGAAMTNAEFDARIAGPNLRRAGQAFNIQNLPPEAFRFEGALTRAGDAYAANNLIAVVGENKLAGDIGLEIGPKVRLTGRLESDNLNLTDLLGQDEPTAEPDEEKVARDRVIPDTPLPLQVLDVADIDMTLRMRHLETKNLDVGDVELKVLIENDALHVDTGQVSLSHGGTMAVILDLARTGDERADVSVSVIGEQYRLRSATDGDGSPVTRPPQDLKLALAGDGATVRELAASADGSISLRLGEGDVDNEFSGYLMRDMVSQVFAAINPMAKKGKYTRLNCGFVEIDIVDGVAKSRALGLQTKELVIASVGTLNLATEALDFSFRVKQREGIGISVASVINPYIKVGGTLASPALTIDKKRGFFAGTVAAVTGGLSILAQGVWDRYLSQEDYCQAVIEALEAGEIPVWEGQSDSS
jgi:uncharacterized protein involved in outer membrane biogenesis